MTNLATVYYKQANYKASEEFFKKALEVGCHIFSTIVGSASARHVEACLKAHSCATHCRYFALCSAQLLMCYYVPSGIATSYSGT